MNDIQILAFIITPIVAGAFVMAVGAYADWDAKRDRRAQLEAHAKKG